LKIKSIGFEKYINLIMRFVTIVIILSITISCQNENIVNEEGNDVNPSKMYLSLIKKIPTDYSIVFTRGKSLRLKGNKFEDCEYNNEHGSLNLYEDGFKVTYGGECPPITYRGKIPHPQSGEYPEALVTEILKTDRYTIKPNFIRFYNKDIPVWSLYSNPITKTRKLNGEQIGDSSNADVEGDVFSIILSNYEKNENEIIVSLRYQKDDGLDMSQKSFYSDSIEVSSIVNLLKIEKTDGMFKSINIKDTIQLGFVYKGFYNVFQLFDYSSKDNLKYYFDIPDDYKKIKTNSQFEILSEYDISEKIKSDEIIEHIVNNSYYLRRVDGKMKTISVNTSDHTKFTINKPDTVKIIEDFKIKFEVPVIDQNGTLIKEKDFSLSYKFLLYNAFKFENIKHRTRLYRRLDLLPNRNLFFAMMMNSDFYREDILEYTKGNKSNLIGKQFVVVTNDLINLEPKFYRTKSGNIVTLPSQLTELNEDEILSNKYSKSLIPVVENETLIELLSEENSNFYKIKYQGKIGYLRTSMYRDKLFKF
jgi:hypothetical protein